MISDRAELNRTSFHNTARNLALEAALLEIADAFCASRIEFIVFKGVPLARRLYGSVGRRSILDNDLIVRRADAPRARDLICNLGYEPYSFRSLQAHLRVDFQFPLIRRGQNDGRSVVDLHWNAFDPALYPVDERLLWQRSETVDLSGRSIKVFDKTLTVLHLSAHFAQHLFLKEYILDDFAAAWNLWHEQIDKDDLLDLAAATGLVPTLDFTFRCAEALGMLDTGPPVIGSRRAALLQRLLPPPRLFAKGHRKDYGRRLVPLVLAPAAGAMRRIRRETFPPLQYLSAIHGRPVSRWLYLHYLERPLRPFLWHRRP